MRLILINQSFWLDEASQAMTSLRPLNEIVFNNLQDFHPPLSYILTYFWIKLGTSENWLRLLPVMFGIATIFFVYQISKKLFGEKIGLLSAFLLSIAPYHIYYSQEFRMYSMVACFATISMLYFLKILENPSKKDSILYILASLLMLYTHYLAITIILTQTLYLLIFQPKIIKRLLVHLLFIGTGFVIWLPMLYRQLTVGVSADSYLPGWSQMLSLSSYISLPLLFVKFILGRIDFDSSAIYSGIILISFSIFAIALFPALKKTKNHSTAFLFFWLLVPIIFTFFISFFIPMFQPFRLLFALPAFYILVAFGISNFKKHQKLIFGMVVLVLVSANLIFYLNPKYWRENWREAITYLRQNQTNESTVIVAWPQSFPPMQWYAPELIIKNSLTSMPANENDIQIQFSTLNNPKTIYYPNYLSQLSDPDKQIEKELEKLGFSLSETKDFQGVGFIYRYQMKE